MTNEYYKLKNTNNYLIEEIVSLAEKTQIYNNYFKNKSKVSFSELFFLFEDEFEIKTNQEVKEGIGRLKTFVKYLLKQGINPFIGVGDEEGLNKNREILAKIKKDKEHQRAVAKILGFDWDLLQKLKLNPFDAVGVQFVNGYALLHYKKNFFVRTGGIEQGSDVWTPALKQARGIIFKITKIKEGEKELLKPKLKAKAFEKFFNLNEVGIKETNLDEILKLAQKYPYAVAIKWDGALGIIYLDDNGEIKITTKGSFFTPSTEKHQQLLNNLLETKLNKEKLKQKLMEGYVPIVEIINEATLVHIPYNFEDLILTGVNKINPETGEFERELSPDEINKFAKEVGFTRTPPLIYKGEEKFKELLKQTEEEVFNSPEEYKEGFVITFYDEKTKQIIRRVKLKFKAYIQLMKYDKLNWGKILNTLTSDTGIGFDTFKKFVEGFSEFEELIPQLANMLSIIIEKFLKFKPQPEDKSAVIKEKKKGFITEMFQIIDKEMKNKYMSFFRKRSIEKSEEYQAGITTIKILNGLKKLYNKLSRLGDIKIFINNIPPLIRNYINYGENKQ